MAGRFARFDLYGPLGDNNRVDMRGRPPDGDVLELFDYEFASAARGNNSNGFFHAWTLLPHCSRPICVLSDPLENSRHDGNQTGSINRLSP